MMSHDLAFAATDAQLGMPEIIRGSFGQNATSNLFHSGIPKKKAAMIQFLGDNLSGAEADRTGLVSRSVEAAELEAFTRNPRGRSLPTIPVRSPPQRSP